MGRPILVVTGVSGSGKTTIGQALAQRLACPFADGDDLHPPANIAKMERGQALTDADRGPWLASIADWIGARATEGTGGVVACSALKRRYRDLLRNGHPDVRFLCLTASRDELARRLAHRRGHFMPASLLDSQLAIFEPLEADEPGGCIDVTESVADSVAAAVGLADVRTD